MCRIQILEPNFGRPCQSYAAKSEKKLFQQMIQDESDFFQLSLLFFKVDFSRRCLNVFEFRAPLLKVQNKFWGIIGDNYITI